MKNKGWRDLPVLADSLGWRNDVDCRAPARKDADVRLRSSSRSSLRVATRQSTLFVTSLDIHDIRSVVYLQ